MPRRFSNPFGNSPSSVVVERAPAGGRPPSSKGSRFTQYFSTTPKGNRSDTHTATAALLEAAASQHRLLQSSSPTISSPSLALPTISLSTATADNANMDEPPTTLFSPPSPAEARRLARQHAQFGPIGSQSHRYVSRITPGEELQDPVEDEAPYFFVVTTYLSYLILMVFGHVRDFFGKRFRQKHYRHLKPQDGYAPLNSDFDNFFVRRLKMRMDDCFARISTGVPGRFITLLDRVFEYQKPYTLTGTTTETLNMSSYNYLGFAQSEGPCADAVEETIRKAGISMVSPRGMGGTNELHQEVEELIARFVGKESSIIFSMGFVTNATAFPGLTSKGCLLISDELNHSSIRFGARLSGAHICMFKHNDMRSLEKVLREQISQGQPRTHRPWKRILVIVEGLYSMEGTMCNLPGLISLKKKYKYNLFVDEAHSIGATGPHGRGVCNYFGIDPAEVDILMGTFTKSFGANGGYIAGDKALIDKLRHTNAGFLYGESPAPPVLAQIHTALRIIKGELIPGQGEERLQRLAFNSRYLRLGLKRLGFIVYGHDDSPIVPLLLLHPAKMPAFSREMLARKISVVIVGYPATPLITSRARFCVSAAHTKDDLDRFLAACDEVGSLLQLKFASGIAGGQPPLPKGFSVEMEKDAKRRGEQLIVQPRWKLEDVLRRGVQDVQMQLR
jgi:serine palmitoyltransferase